MALHGSVEPSSITVICRWASFVFRVKGVAVVFAVLSFSLHVLRYLARASMSDVSVFSTVIQFLSEYRSARSSAYAYLDDEVEGRSLR